MLTNYLSEVFEIAVENNSQTRGSFQIMERSFHKTSASQKMKLSFVDLTIWSKTPGVT